MFDATKMTPDNFEGSWKFAVKKPIAIRIIQMNLPEGFEVETLEGKMAGLPGDYLAIGVNGEKYIIKKEIFEKTHQVVPGGTRMIQLPAAGVQNMLEMFCRGLLSMLPSSDTAAVVVGETYKEVYNTNCVVVPRQNDNRSMEVASRHMTRAAQKLLNNVTAAKAEPQVTQATAAEQETLINPPETGA